MGKKRLPDVQPCHRVFLVDEQPVLRDGLAQLLSLEPDLCVCGHTGNAVKAICDIAEAKPDCVIFDIALKGQNGLEIIKRIKLAYADLPILAFTIHDEFLYAQRALRAGARGYVMKHSSTAEVLDAIRTVLRGEIYLSPPMRDRMLERISNGACSRNSPFGGDLERLTDRQLQVLHLIGDGCGTRQIAERLHLSGKTIEAYRAHIKQKLNLRNNLELLRVAMEAVHQTT